MRCLPNCEYPGFVFVQHLDSDMILCKAGVDLGVDWIPKVVKPEYSYEDPDISPVTDTSNLEEFRGVHSEVDFYRKIRNHEADLKDKRNMSRRVIPDFYRGNPSDPEVAKILKEYNIPVLDVNMNKYPLKKEINERENSGIEI